NEDLRTILEKESDEFIKSNVEDLEPIPSESEDTSGSDSDCDLSACENNFISGNPTPSSDFEIESLSTSPIPYEDSDPLLEETDILLSHFDNSLPKYETFSFDIEEKSSGSTTTNFDYSLSDYEAFYFDDDHIEDKNTNGMIKVLPPKTTKEVVVRERERKARTTSLMALLEDHLAKFHKTADAKEMWEAIKSRFGGNDDSRRRDVGYNGNKARDNGRSPAYQDDLKALVTIDGEDIDWSGHVEEDAQNYAMMAYF
nr:xylulose kinase-1 [Tanacetum cinerariifolium]